jgi:hypothetical protein
MFARILGTLAFVAVANGQNHNNVIKFDSDTDFNDIARKLVYDNLYSGDIPASINHLVNTGTTKVNLIKNDDQGMPSTNVPDYCKTLPLMDNPDEDSKINTFCNGLAYMPEGELISQYFKTTIPQGTLSGVVNTIGIAGGTLDGTTRIAYYYGDISTTLIQMTEQHGTYCHGCHIISDCCGCWIDWGCKESPRMVNRDDTINELADCQDYLEYTLRPNFAPPS